MLGRYPGEGFARLPAFSGFVGAAGKHGQGGGRRVNGERNMSKRNLLLASAAYAALATAGSAATVTATFDFTASGPTGWDSSYAFSEAGAALVVTAHNYNSSKEIYRDVQVGRWTGWGLGIGSYSGDNHRVDGYCRDEVLSFSFDREVKILSVEFGAFWGSHNKFDLFVGDAGELVFDSWDYVDDTVALGGATGTWFGIGASAWNSAFKVRSITVSWDDGINNNPAPIPLPAGGALMLTGLAGLAALRRKRRRTDR